MGLREVELHKNKKHTGHHTEQYAFSDFLHKRLSREWALYEWQHQQPKPNKPEKDEKDERRIDFAGPTYDEVHSE